MGPEIELNPTLDWVAIAKEYSIHKRIQIPNILTEQSAERLLLCLEKEVTWHFAFMSDSPNLISYTDIGNKTDLELREFRQQLSDISKKNTFQYNYDCYPLLQAYKEKWHPTLYINRWLEFVNSQVMLTVIRKLTDISDIVRGDGQATRYGPNQYLTRHTDDVPSEGRRVAYVMNLSKEWDPNWGGYLQFFTENGNLHEAYLPRFNSLSLFKVPQDHSVGVIAHFAKKYRYGLTGWFRAPQ